MALEEDFSNEAVEHSGEQEGGDEKEGKVEQVDGQVKVAGDLVATLQLLAVVSSHVHQEEPEHAVQRGEDPDKCRDALGSRHGTHCLCLHWVADGNISGKERKEREGCKKGGEHGRKSHLRLYVGFFVSVTSCLVQKGPLSGISQTMLSLV